MGYTALLFFMLNSAGQFSFLVLINVVFVLPQGDFFQRQRPSATVVTSVICPGIFRSVCFPPSQISDASVWYVCTLPSPQPYPLPHTLHAPPRLSNIWSYVWYYSDITKGLHSH